MANYVKFLRGSPEAYEKLRHKDSDTLYFIYEEDEANGSLYLGSKLIAGEDIANESSGVSSLAELKDVLLSEDLNTESFLVYDPRAVAWVNKPLEDLIFMGATPQSAGLVGLVPAPELGQTDLFLRSDGTWSSPSAIDHFVLTIENKNHKSHYDLILEAIENLGCISGDIIIIKDLISNDKWQYVAYVFDNGNWHAMDGNYNAENVYFDEDLITTTEIGNITLTDGKAVIATAGKNLKEVFETIFVKEENPTIVDPYIILTCKEAKAYEVGTVIKPTYSAFLNSGTYSFGPVTGVTVTGWSIVDSNGNGSVNNSGEFVDFIVKDNIDYLITATAMYSNGNIPLTNLGNKYPEGAIKAGSTTITQKLVSGFRKSFYGTVANKDELTSDLIRSLVHYDTQLMPKASVKVNLPIGALKMIFAYPANLPDLESIKDTNGFEANILNSFKKEIMKIEGNNHYEPIDYKVYTIEFANPYSTANYYTFTVGEED